MTPAHLIRQSVAHALGIEYPDMPCFTVLDHQDQPMLIILHGGKHEGIYVERKGGRGFMMIKGMPR